MSVTMIFLLPDQTLSMGGGRSIGTELGKETEGKVQGLFVQAGRGATEMGAPSAKAGADRLNKAQRVQAQWNGQINPTTTGNRT